MRRFVLLVAAALAQTGFAQEIETVFHTAPKIETPDELVIVQPNLMPNFTNLAQKGDAYANFRLPEQQFGRSADLLKKNTLYFADGLGGYRSYDIYDSWMKPGRNYQTFFDFSQPCPTGLSPQGPYDAFDVSSTVALGVLFEALDLPQQVKIGKRVKICLW
ncbi:hypothetical protein [Flavobacterium selenitireducens]|uniref:hypothetical protein n=1 Tax=Flavobacterium selenitireducens TaxID=2722704 RepID=UPI00168A92EE|nr:hypothetical protein [Flavobacterium selenitireducens]MBD3581346.1 hypothetical protein [Flavobacterium selenitireducens]